MFTGLIEEQGRFVGRSGDRFRFAAELVLQDTQVDDSIAVNGCCLTVVDISAASSATSGAASRSASNKDSSKNNKSSGWWEADVADETLARTALGDLQENDPVNFERAMRYADRLGGHMVQGHVDGMGAILQPGPHLRVKLPAERNLDRYLVEKGSITVDGVSLTCFDVADGAFSVALIPHTMAVTTLGSRQVGHKVNLEVDLVAKYVERLLAPMTESA